MKLLSLSVIAQQGMKFFLLDKELKGQKHATTFHALPGLITVLKISEI